MATRKMIAFSSIFLFCFGGVVVAVVVVVVFALRFFSIGFDWIFLFLLLFFLPAECVARAFASIPLIDMSMENRLV